MKSALLVGGAVAAAGAVAGAVVLVRHRGAAGDAAAEANLDDLAAPPPQDITPDLLVSELQAVMPTLGDAKAAEYLPYLNAAMSEAEITTQLRRAAFIAQVAEESGELKWWEELAPGQAYEGRKDLGNTTAGDGPRYKGRGPIQLTGRNNYQKAGAALGLDLVGDPDQVAQPSVGFRTAAWFWRTNGLKGKGNCNALADAGDFVGITRVINGGTNGLEVRQRYYATAKAVLGVPEETS